MDPSHSEAKTNARRKENPPMDSSHSNAKTNAPREEEPQAVERFIKTTFDQLPSRTKVLVALFSAMNSATTLTKGFELSDHLWKSMRFDTCGPLVGESEEVNWLKGVSDGILMVSNYS